MTDDHPYRTASLDTLINMREGLVKQLEELDRRIEERAYETIPCYSGLSGWQRLRLRRAWRLIAKLGPWRDIRCEMETWDPCPARYSDKPCQWAEQISRPKRLRRRMLGGYQPHADRPLDPARVVPPRCGSGVAPPARPRPGPPAPEPTRMPTGGQDYSARRRETFQLQDGRIQAGATTIDKQTGVVSVDYTVFSQPPPGTVEK